MADGLKFTGIIEQEEKEIGPNPHGTIFYAGKTVDDTMFAYFLRSKEGNLLTMKCSDKKLRKIQAIKMFKDWKPMERSETKNTGLSSMISGSAGLDESNAAMGKIGF